MRISMLLGLWLFASNEVLANPLLESDSHMMFKVVDEMMLSKEVLDFLSQNNQKHFVFSNIENDQYTDDLSPEYVVQDVLYARLKSKLPKLSLLERDPDILSVLNDEMKGLHLPSEIQKKTSSSSQDSVLEAYAKEHREAAGHIIEDVLAILAKQDVLVSTGDSCCGNTETTTQVVANEIGTDKSALISTLIQKYMDLYSEGLSKVDSIQTTDAEQVQSKIFLNQADYLFTYRLYDFGVWRSSAERLIYIKMHVRIVDMKTGAIVVSDFMENKISDKTTLWEHICEIFGFTKKGGTYSLDDYGRPGSRTSKNGASNGVFGITLASKNNDQAAEEELSLKAKKNKFNRLQKRKRSAPAKEFSLPLPSLDNKKVTSAEKSNDKQPWNFSLPLAKEKPVSQQNQTKKEPPKPKPAKAKNPPGLWGVGPFSTLNLAFDPRSAVTDLGLHVRKDFGQNFLTFSFGPDYPVDLPVLGIGFGRYITKPNVGQGGIASRWTANITRDLDNTGYISIGGSAQFGYQIPLGKRNSFEIGLQPGVAYHLDEGLKVPVALYTYINF